MATDRRVSAGLRAGSPGMDTDRKVRATLRAGPPSKASDRRVCAALKLDDELLISIATKMRVPLQTIVQLRCVCKTWKTALADHHSLKCFFQLLSQTPLYIAPARGIGYDLAAYDVGIRCWHKWRSTLHLEYFSLYDVCGDAGDWLLVKKSSIPWQPFQGLWLANPTKKFFRKLPSFPDGRSWAIGRDPYAMGVGLDESSKSCRVFAVDRLDFQSHKVYLYDFALNSWKAFGAWQGDHRETICCMTLYEGTLYGLKRIQTEEGYRIIVCFFDQRNSRWQKFSAQMSWRSRFEHLFQWQGHLMFVLGGAGEQNRFRDLILTSVHIWQLDKEKQVWVESMKMPDHLVDHFFVSDMDVPSFRLDCVTSCDQICVTSSTIVRQGVTNKCKSRHVMCDLSKGLWWDVPEPPFQYQDESRFSILLPNLTFDHEKF